MAAAAAEMLGLQRRVGNQVALTQVPRIQAKLLVGSAYDPAERQADEIAHHVMRHMGGGSEGRHDDVEVEAEPPPLRRAVMSPDGLGAPVGLDGGEVDPAVASSIQAARGRGHGLPEPVLRPFERAFGTDLSGVRVHHDNRASELNRAVSARAFTLGSDIFLGAGQYRPDSASGQELLAHEVTHTIQQRR
jgi:hypothetical protein